MDIKSILFAVFTIINCQTLIAQHGVVAAGSSAAGTGGSVSYSIGQIDYITVSGDSCEINQGLQQPYELFTVSIFEPVNAYYTVSVYPNPAQNQTLLSIEGADISNMSYELYNIEGKLLFQQKITEMQTTILLAEYNSSVLLVKLLNNNHPVKTFKIVKTN